MNSLEQLARTAVLKDCRDGGDHQWESHGGRACSFSGTKNCSQTVYVCTVCGEWDYGYVGGPGHADCVEFCQAYEPPCRPGQALREKYL